MKSRHLFLLGVAALAAAAGLALGSGFAAAKPSAAVPCSGLTGTLATRCRQAIAACGGASPSIKQACVTAVENAFNVLRTGGAKTTTPTSTTTTTPSQTAPPPAPAATPPAAGAPPPPVKGTSADATPVAGTVLVDGKPLVAGERIPINATVDATNGTVTLESVSPTGAVQRANFAGATFKLSQPASGVTTLTLKGGNFGVCSTKGTRQVAAAAPKTTVVRNLWGNGHGAFATTGRYAAATVRGTIWETQDRCDGTRIFVKQDTVSVFDLVLKRTVTLHSGQSYLAKP